MKTLEQKIEALKTLRGSHDQKMRTQGIHILHGPSTATMTETEKWLEANIKHLESLLHMQQMDAYVDD